MTLKVLLLAGLSVGVVFAVQGPYDQCGGQNWSGGTTCVSGWKCTYQNPYYSQCLPGPSTASSSPVTSGSTAVQGPYAQCGGQNWSGGTSCVSGWTCVYSNPYYSQCLQVSSSNQMGSTTKVSTAASTIIPVSSVTTSTAKTTATTSVLSSSIATSSVKTTVSTSAAASSSAATKVQGPYEQCGGQNWAGGTTCVAGWTCVYSNPYYSQCLQPTGSTSTFITQSTTPVSVSTALSSSRSTSSTSTSSSTALPNQGVTYKASFTHYGAGDSFGSPNCNTKTAACFFYTYPGYSAAVSQNLYGAGPGEGVGPACGTCWRLIGQTDSSGNRLSNAGTTIVVMVNNLCPANGNPLCSQNGLSGTNQYGANVNFDLCSDSGAEAAFFGNSGVGLAIGTATQVDCSQWSGTVIR